MVLLISIVLLIAGLAVAFGFYRRYATNDYITTAIVLVISGGIFLIFAAAALGLLVGVLFWG